MEEIRDIIDNVVRSCQQVGTECPDALAAFVAKTVVESDSSIFSLDQNLTPKVVNEVILRSVEKILEQDNPAIETMKMQIDYDTSFMNEDSAAQKAIRARNKMIAAHRMTIVEIEMGEANDFEALTTLYRKIFRFLLDFSPNAKQGDRNVEREVAAALESVFPRIGLKAFVKLSQNEKSTQLMELARIVLGIRLFNRDQGRGGVGIESMDKEAMHLSNVIMRDMDGEMEKFSDAIAKYQQAIVKALLDRRRHELAVEREEKYRQDKNDTYMADDKEAVNDDDDQNKEDAKGTNKQSMKTKALGMNTAESKIGGTTGPATISNYLIDRWTQEVANRRQYLNFVRTLQDEIRNVQGRITNLCDRVQNELSTLKQMVGSRSSVPKEMVYPRFDALGSTWVDLHQEMLILKARNVTFQTLTKYRLSFVPTLDERFYRGELSPLVSPRGASAKYEEEVAETKEPAETISNAPTLKLEVLDSSELGMTAEEIAEPKDPQVETERLEKATEKENAKGAVLLTVDKTPDFMLLPLELQGFCPWTMVHARGLLVPGKPAMGVVRYKEMYYVCDHANGLRSFLENPQYYLDKIRERALRNPEYIHLLRLQSWFPSASIARLLEAAEPDHTGAGAKGLQKDACTETPTHFVERNIDVNYHWNEWELRRRALQIVNLQNCKTSGSQTDHSHFRRDNNTQVYLPREKASQTRRDRGVNPPTVTTYMAGLRGQQSNKLKIGNKIIAQEKEGDSIARIVTLKLDL
jgi:hypothetical protein